MTAVLVSVADAIYDELATLTLSESYHRYRTYGDWEDLLSDLDTGLRLDVVPNSCLSEMLSRGKLEYMCNVSILLRKKFAVTDRTNGRIDNVVIDDLVEDLQTIHEFFAPSQPAQTGRKLSALPDARWHQESSVKAPFSRKMLRDHGQFSGWVNVVYGYPRQFGT